LRKRGLLLFFILPASGLVVLFFLLSNLNRAFIQARTQSLVGDQLTASAQILEMDFVRLIDSGGEPQAAVDRYAGAADLYFMALLDGAGEVLGWASQFEGYLPLETRGRTESASWTIESPVGRILNVRRPFTAASGRLYALHVGYSLARLEEMLSYSRRNFLLLFSALAVAGILLFTGVYRMHMHSVIKAEEAAAERQEKERYREISGFTAGVAHEIKNPLNSLGLMCELIERKAPADLAADAALGKAEVQKIGRIVDQLSSALRAPTLRPEPVRLDELAAEVVRDLAPEAEALGVPVGLISSEPAVVRADRGLLAQALGNLIRNALQAGSSGAVELRIERHRSRVLLWIDDRGPGIPDEDRERIFEPFFSTKPGGLGVGLFLTRRIIEAHGGRIEALSRPGGGTRFRIELAGGSA
jgi:signal transduction histidine kinase